MSGVAGREGILFVVSAPSGTGKSSVGRPVVGRVAGLEFSVSFTTRPPRAGEVEGEDYHFVDVATFRRRIENGAFLEHAEVFGRHYGTGLERTRQRLAEGIDLLLDIDVQGAAQVRCGPVPSVSIMILPPDFATLERRLRSRGSESDEEVRRRLANARREAEQYRDFDYVVVNDRLEVAIEDVAAIVRCERLRTRRSADRVERVLNTFPEER